MNSDVSVLLLMAAFAQPGYRTIRTSGDCSPVIIAEVARVDINCKGGFSQEEREKLRRLPSVTAWDVHSKQVEQLRSQVAATNVKLDAVQEDDARALQELRSEIASARDEFRKLLREQESLLQKLAAELASQRAITGGSEARDLDVQLRIEQQVGDASTAVFSEFRSALQAHEVRFAQIEQQMAETKREVADLKKEVVGMREILGGKVSETVGFVGFGLGAARIDQKWYPRGTAEYELFLPHLGFADMKGSLLFEFSYIKWIKETTTTTLPGVPAQQTTEDNKLGVAGIGGRLFLGSPSEYTNTYVGANLGYSVVGERTFSYGLSVGAEYFRPSTRFAVEARWDRFDGIKETETTFNPFGNATVTERERTANSFSVGLRVSFR